MPLVPMNELLADAVARDYTVVQFNTDCIEITQSFLRTAEEYAAPIIVGVGQGAVKDGKIAPIAAMLRDYCARSKLPVCLHLDHSEDPDQIMQALRAGFTSIMIDGSARPLAENIEVTNHVLGLCRPLGVSVEAELGRIPGVEDDMVVTEEQANKVDLAVVEEFVSNVSVDALAVAVGSAHGIYKAEPKLDFELLAQLVGVTDTPLVLHGGSGIPDTALRKAFGMGMKKLNVGTELRLGFLRGVHAGVEAGDSIYACFERGRKIVDGLVLSKLEVSGSAGKA
ncbi:ketose-bisphosphate aldolase [Salipiger marinus]|uniref:Fructose-bisphosphate aldolase n=1 Tax=Salipiger marinus TaxID=555512 RepID=A0A1G8TDW1_9RHOB|nr:MULTISPECIES: class II fructose-bisphosphate aldolase [Salipiger]MCD1619305.1 class II fructose-bisphosphate aldolase [Salipiger manganoxidans]MEB3421584.1 class II fructose-bisphosphate aldolase [Salipiger manganoxidans]SDJ39756.1 fructose-bisphosphate aldolase [Salipiger marinus]